MNEEFYLKSKFLTKLKILHGFTISNSKFYTNLNFSRENEKIGKSFKFLENSFNEKIFSLNQCHSNKIFEIKKTNQEFNLEKNNYNLNQLKKGDGMITREKNIIIGIYSADCVPILIAGKNKDFVAAIHSGWQGSFNGINEKAIEKIEKISQNKNDIFIVIGPSIFQENYEVKDEFMENFIKKDKESEQFFLKKNSKIFFDNREYLKFIYKKSGFQNIEMINIDTYSDERFFSYRKFKKKLTNADGRFFSFIMI